MYFRGGIVLFHLNLIYIMKNLSFIFVFIFNYSFSQTFSLSNQNHYGTTGLNNCQMALQTNEGGFLLISSLTSANNDHVGPVYGNQDAWLIKLDNNKQIEWELVYGGSDDDLFSDFIVLSNGNILVSGHSNSPISGNKTVGTNGFYDYWVLMLDSLGNILWQKNFGTDQNDQISQKSIVKINENSFLIGGRTTGGINADKTDASNGGIDMWFIKIDVLGNLVSDFSIGGDSDDYLVKTQLLSNDYFLMLSSSTSGISGDKNSAFVGGGGDSWIIESDTNGIVLNQNFYGGTGTDALGDFMENGSEIVLTGYSDSPISGNKQSSKLGNVDGIILKMNSSLVPISEQSYGGSGSWSYFREINKLSNNKFIFSGLTRGTTNPYRNLPSNGANDIWLFGTNENLDYEWNYSFGGDGNESIVLLNQISNYEFDVIGHYESSSFSGDLTVPNYGTLSDILYARIDSDLFIFENENSFSIYPNPTSDYLFIDNISNIISEYTITNINGQVVKFEKYQNKIDVSNLTNGIYFISVNDKNTKSTLKFIKN